MRVSLKDLNGFSFLDAQPDTEEIVVKKLIHVTTILVAKLYVWSLSQLKLGLIMRLMRVFASSLKTLHQVYIFKS